MEDVHVCLLGAGDAAADGAEGSSVSHFAIYDGHGGCSCAQFVSQRLHEAVLAAGLLTGKADAHGESSGGAATTDCKAQQQQQQQQQGWQLDVKAAKQAIIQAFASVDEQLLKQCKQLNWQDGATAVAVWVVGPDKALVANVGDAKCVLARAPEKAGSSSLRALVLTKDHLAIYPGERLRIQKAGGHVSADGRLNGRIQVSRAFGDAQFKPFGSSAVPDVTAFSISSKDKFMLCACDGFWGVMDPQATVELVQQQLQAGKDEKAITNKLINEAVIERRSKDNCTVMLVRFERPQDASL
ncbi:phosphatase 2C-like domain-containing protein [Scenedesmus sp. NREL 46B-D3]|nr:phosphatase 2C-like domain-containing protein [Scenedesmus sp. NREL 46B-D3]